MLERHGGLCLKWVCPGWSGVPDRIVLLPGGRIMFVETKRPKDGKLSAMQKWWLKKLRGLGFDVWVVWRFEDIDTLELVIKDTTNRKEIKV
jgi:ubiquinone/menaquinone biosynthesis C-methylase UbiE